MAAPLSDTQRLKLGLFADGLEISPAADAALREANEGRALTPADYASTSGVILRLADDVWVNAPIAQHNPNFVTSPPFTLDHGADGLVVHGAGLDSPAEFWLLPDYHGTTGTDGRPLNNYVFTHADRVRLAPVQGCSMVCTFCNIPYEDRYATKPVEAMVEAVRMALEDPLQPAHHLLISGGTPSRRDVPFLREVYSRVLQEFPQTAVDIMMVPVDGLFDLPALDRAGLNEISVNLEVFDETIAAGVMRQKHRQGRDYYLDFLGDAAQVLGGHRVRSMLLVGLEPLEQTLKGVQAVAERGCTPVLSPFRPDPATPMRDHRPPTAAELEQAYLRAAEITEAAGVGLGPACPPCGHNTLSFSWSGAEGVGYRHPLPNMVRLAS